MQKTALPPLCIILNANRRTKKTGVGLGMRLCPLYCRFATSTIKERRQAAKCKIVIDIAAAIVLV